MAIIFELNREQTDQLKIMIRHIIHGEINCAESIGFVLNFVKKMVSSGQITWEELGTTEEELLAKKREAK